MGLGLAPLMAPLLTSLQQTLSPEGVLSALEQERLRAAEALAQQSRQASGAAAQAQADYRGAAAAPSPQVPPLDIFLPSLIGNVASVLGGEPAYREQAQDQIKTQMAELARNRIQNLTALRDVWSQKAQAAQQLGDLEAQEKARSKSEQLARTMEVVMQRQREQGAMERLLVQEQGDTDRARILASGKEAAAREKAASNEELAPTLTREGLNAAALMYAKTGTMVPMGMGKAGVKVRETIVNRAAEMMPELDVAANQAQYRSDRQSRVNLTRMADAAEAYERTVLRNSNVMLEAMAMIPDTGIPVLNTPLRAVSLKGLGSREIAAFNAARQTVIPEFARLLNSPTLAGQLTDEARKEIDRVISGSYSLNQMTAVIDLLKRDAANRRDSFAQQIREIDARLQANPTAQRDTAQTSTTSEPTVLMEGPKGQRLVVPPESVAEAVKRGWKRVKP